MPLFLLVTAALAAPTSLELPVTLRYAEYTGWGEDPTVVDAAWSATVQPINVETGATFETRGELFLKDRHGAGRGEVAFEAEPAGSLRTWAIHLLDASGNPLVAEPEIVDVLFGEGGDGTIVARSSADIVVRTVKMKKRGSSRSTQDGTHTLAVSVQGIGVQAAYVGIEELTSDAAPIGAHTDMESMTASVYATYQALDLDALVPLDSWHGVYDGTVTIEGIDLTDNVVEGGAAFEYGVSLYGEAVKGGSTALATMRLGPPGAIVVRIKPPGRPKHVTLRSEGQVFDSYDGSMNVVVEGDARDLEVAALLTPAAGAVAPASDTLLTLDPSDVALGGTGSGTGAFPAKPAEAGVLEASVEAYDKDGNIMDDLADMLGQRLLFTPTGPSAVEGSTRLRYVGEALRNAEGRAMTRGARLVRDADGTTTAAIEVLGIELAEVASLRLVFDDASVKPISIPVAVTLTSFSLDWTFPTDPTGSSYAMDLYFYGATAPLAYTVEDDGQVIWSGEGDGDWTFGEDPTGVYAKDKITKEEAQALAKALVDAGAEVELK